MSLNKYFAHKFTAPDGEVFDSKKEYERWFVLSQEEKAGKIYNLRRQVRMQILPTQYETREKQLKTKVKLIKVAVDKAKYYTADFCYEDGSHGYVEDVKSKYTRQIRDYPLRRHLCRMLLDKWNEKCGDGYWKFIET